jgi:hypothetical protein
LAVVKQQTGQSLKEVEGKSKGDEELPFLLIVEK